MSETTAFTPEVLRARYKELCAKRDKTNEELAPLKKELEIANLEAEKTRLKATEIAEKISKARDGMEWIAMKKEIGMLAKALGGK